MFSYSNYKPKSHTTGPRWARQSDPWGMASVLKQLVEGWKTSSLLSVLCSPRLLLMIKTCPFFSFKSMPALCCSAKILQHPPSAGFLGLPHAPPGPRSFQGCLAITECAPWHPLALKDLRTRYSGWLHILCAMDQCVFWTGSGTELHLVYLYYT